MFDVAPTELLLVAIVALVVIGPKDLPKAMRFVGHWVGKARGMARHFRTGLDAMMREAELEELEKQWRAHNEAIMKAHPTIDLTPDRPGTSADPAAPPAPVPPPAVASDGAPPAAPVAPVVAPQPELPLDPPAPQGERG
jgi:sec-independent protein translocase protein TatB